MSLIRKLFIRGASGNEAEVTASNELKVISTGQATSSKQDLLLTELQLKADLTETQPVSASSLPLPSGASTSALQTTGNNSLNSIDTKTVSNYISAPNTTASLLGANATFTGTFEDVSKFTTIAVAILGTLSTASGTLYVDLSQDGVTYVPLAFNITDPTFDLPHVINIVEKYYRVRYVNGAIAQTGAFHLQTKISNGQQLGLNHKMGDLINGKLEGQIVKSVQTGSDPLGNYVNQRADGLAFETKTNLGIGGTFDSGILSLVGFSQIQTHILSNQSGTATVTFYSDSAGTDIIRTLVVPYTGPQGFITLSTLSFPSYVRYTYTNGAVAQTDFYYGAKFLTKSLSGQILSLEATVSSGMVANLGRNIIAGKLPDLTYSNVNLNELSAIQVDTTSDLPTYSASILNLAPGLLPTDVFTISGSATKIIRITKVSISGVKTTNGTVDFVLLKRSTLNTLGTSTTPTSVSRDSSNAVSTAVVKAYTGLPTVLGTLVGNFEVEKLFISNGGSIGDRKVFEYGLRPSQIPTLRGVNELIALNLQGVTPVGGMLNINVEWIESNY